MKSDLEELAFRLPTTLLHHATSLSMVSSACCQSEHDMAWQLEQSRTGGAE